MKKWTNDDIEFLKINYPKFGLNYCSDKLNRSKKSVGEKRIKLGILKNNLLTKKIYYEENLKPIINNSLSYGECLDKLNRSRTGAAYTILKKYINLYNIDTTHFNNHTHSNGKIPINDILVENSKYTSTSHLKNRLYKEGFKERKCELCGQNEEWQGKKMSLILDHINGINNDNRLENLQIVCPNCNATLPTHCIGDKKKKRIEQLRKKKIIEKQVLNKEKNANNGLTIKQIETNKNRRYVERPPYEQLIDEINDLGYLGTGRKYGVSDNAIRKWKNIMKNIIYKKCSCSSVI